MRCRVALRTSFQHISPRGRARPRRSSVRGRIDQEALLAEHATERDIQGGSDTPTLEWEYREPVGTGQPGSPATLEQVMLKAALTLTAALNVERVCEAVLEAVERVFDAESSWIAVYDEGSETLRVRLFRGAGQEAFSGAEIPPDRGLVGLAFRSKRLFFVPDVRHESRWYDPARVHASPLKSVLILPLVYDDRPTGVLGLSASRFTAENPPSTTDMQRLRIIAAQAAIGIANARLYEASQQDRRRLRELLRQRQQLRGRVTELRAQVDAERSSREIIGESAAIKELLAQVGQVAGADVTVLLLGETGTGKELVARTLHRQSRRGARPFVPVNCAAMPQTLVESELFGHERGAFTDARTRKAGRFEQAHHGTLFLDEIGDLPLEAQAKLLRVLQDGLVQRVGGTDAVKVDVRVVAATNQDLAALVAAGRFRADLYYRLNVFPVRLPPLRDRREDIPVLARHFVQHYAAKLNRRITAVEDEVWTRLQQYDWPGNVRELQNVAERAILLAGSDGVLQAGAIRLDPPPVAPPATPLDDPPRMAEASPAPPSSGAPDPVTLADADRQAILTALRRARGRISGKQGAAHLLGLKPTTLHAKMKKLGISRDDVWDS